LVGLALAAGAILVLPSYELYGALFQGASGLAPAFVGADTAVIASFASGR
jgi:hypothetical protein